MVKPKVVRVEAYELNGKVYRSKEDLLVEVRKEGLRELTNGLNVVQVLKKLSESRDFRDAFREKLVETYSYAWSDLE